MIISFDAKSLQFHHCISHPLLSGLVLLHFPAETPLNNLVSKISFFLAFIFHEYLSKLRELTVSMNI